MANEQDWPWTRSITHFVYSAQEQAEPPGRPALLVREQKHDDFALLLLDVRHTAPEPRPRVGYAWHESNCAQISRPVVSGNVDPSAWGVLRQAPDSAAQIWPLSKVR